MATTPAATEIYRQSQVGQALKDALDELCQVRALHCPNLTRQSQQITPSLAMLVLQQFDRSMANVFAAHLKNRITFKVPSYSLILCDYICFCFVIFLLKFWRTWA